MDERQRAAWRALGLGPVWVARGPATAARAVASTAGQAAVPAADAAATATALPTGATVPAPAGMQPAASSAGEIAAPAAAQPAVPAGDGAVRATADPVARLRRLDALREQVAVCPKCRLCRTRTRTVFGEGDPQASWMFIGEGPGAEEDARGEPFVGQSGRLLDAMLASIGLQRARDVYITNMVKCRPPGNRNPQADEIASCAPYLREQIELIRPALLVLLGRVAAQALLGTTDSIGALRGRVHRCTIGALELPAIVTYHPAYLLRTPADKAKAWRDLCAARAAHARLARQ